MSTDDQYRTTREQQMSSLDRWLNWEPGHEIIEKTLSDRVPKVTKPNFGTNGTASLGTNPIKRTRKTRVIDGHSVSEILWETPRSVVFRDPEGRIWRRVHSWDMTWEVRIESAKSPS